MLFAMTTRRPVTVLLLLALIVDASLIRRMSAPTEPTVETDASRNIESIPEEPLSTTSASSVIFDDWGLEKNGKASSPSFYPSQMPFQFSSPSANPSDRPSFQPTDRLLLAPSESPSPSSTPSSDPSPLPSTSTINRPSLAHSVPPSSSPSSEPSSRPSISPTGKPSLAPSKALSPSAMPSPDPPTQPSTSPTERKSLARLNPHSPSPFPNPSSQPSMSPTASTAPSESPSPSSTPSSGPSSQLSISPTTRRSLAPLGPPSSDPSSRPSMSPTESPLLSFSIPSSTPSSDPSPQPSISPLHAPKKPTDSPSRMPSHSPSALPSEGPSENPTLASSTTALITTMCLVADTPYNEEQRRTLLKQVKNMPDDCEFVFHLGDLRTSQGFNPCTRETYSNASAIMSRSSKPVFMLLGDNEWNDCPNHQEALDFWHEEFDGFLDDKWPSALARFDVASQPGHTENVYFIHNKALFIGLNIVGGRVHNKTEWHKRLKRNFIWTRKLIKTHVMDAEDPNVVVMMAHATPVDDHRLFFNPMRDYIEDELDNTVPILYLNEDSHKWKYEPDFYSQKSWLRITVEGESRAPILKVFVDGSASGGTVKDAFSYDRGL